MRGTGRAAFVAALLLIVGTLNVIYGIGSISDASAVIGDQRLIFTNLHTYGWVLIIIGVIQFTAGLSLLGGNTYGRVLGIIGASIGALNSLAAIGGRNPWWSLGAFALCIYSCTGSSSSAATTGHPSRPSALRPIRNIALRMDARLFRAACCGAAPGYGEAQIT